MQNQWPKILKKRSPFEIMQLMFKMCKWIFLTSWLLCPMENNLLWFLVEWANLILINPGAVVSMIQRWRAVQMLRLKALLCSQPSGAMGVLRSISWRIDYRDLQAKCCENFDIAESNSCSFFDIKPLVDADLRLFALWAIDSMNLI